MTKFAKFNRIAIYLFVFVSCYMFFNIDVQAQAPGPVSPTASPWQEASPCGPGQIHPKDFNYITNLALPAPDWNKQSLINALIGGSFKYCGEGDDFQVNGWSSLSKTISYCDSNHTTAVNDRNEIVRGVGSVERCCPKDKPISSSSTIGVCCEPGAVPIFGTSRCTNGSSERSEFALNDSFTDRNLPIVVSTGPTYSCPQDGCLLNSGNSLITNDSDVNPRGVSTTDKCLERGGVIPGVPDKFCLANKWVTQDELNAANINNNVVQCSMLAEPERTRCYDCFSRNPTTGAQTFVYSSLGCIDTRQNPFITRLFQIGFGLLGGFAIIMIMWGAVQRQSTDPAKIQEGTSKITAAIASIVMISAAIPLLRYLGINLIGILPFNIFS